MALEAAAAQQAEAVAEAANADAEEGKAINFSWAESKRLAKRMLSPPPPRCASELSDVERPAQFVQKRSKADPAHASSTMPPPPANTKRSDDSFANFSTTSG
eukprot:2515793-Pleurochrysis_carterae.AAC.3